MSSKFVSDVEELAADAIGKVRRLERAASSAPLREAFCAELGLLQRDMDRHNIKPENQKMPFSDYARFWLDQLSGGK